MARKILYFGLFVCIAWAVMGQPLESSGYFGEEEGCYVKEIDRAIPIGSVVTPPGQCFSVTCANETLGYTLCGDAKNTKPNCFVTDTDLTKTFPDCCPSIKCISKTSA